MEDAGRCNSSKQEEEEEEEEEEEDRRREAAIAGTSLKPSAGLTSQQLSKFKELRRRRLQIKSGSKINKKDTERCHTRQRNVIEALHIVNPQSTLKDSCTSALKTHDEDDLSSAKQENMTLKSEPQRRKKLHWGLDTKERWERKANM